MRPVFCRIGAVLRLAASSALLAVGESRLNSAEITQIFTFNSPFPITRPRNMIAGVDLSYFKSPWSTPDMWLREVLNFPNATGKHHTQYMVNFGAHFGKGIDDIVAYTMQSSKVDGFAIDSDDKMPWTGARVSKFTGFVTTTNVVSVLKVVPRSPLLLKVDIDSVDVDVALFTLDVISPLFIFVEINEKVPPPMCYCNRQPTDRQWQRLTGHAYGCSIEAYANALATKQYQLVSVILNDALFVRADLAAVVADQLPEGKLPSIHEAYQRGYAQVPGIMRLFPWNKPVHAWTGGQSLSVRAEMVKSHFKAYGDGERRNMTYPFVVHAKPASWPCAESAHKRAISDPAVEVEIR